MRRMGGASGACLLAEQCSRPPYGSARPVPSFSRAISDMSPGQVFGDPGKGYVRLNFGCPRAVLEEALKRMEKAVHALKSK